MSEGLKVEFKSVVTKSEAYYCDACRGIGRVMQLKLPITNLYNGQILSTMYHEYWLCAPCRTKLVHALDFPEDEE